MPDHKRDADVQPLVVAMALRVRTKTIQIPTSHARSHTSVTINSGKSVWKCGWCEVKLGIWEWPQRHESPHAKCCGVNHFRFRSFCDFLQRFRNAKEICKFALYVSIITSWLNRVEWGWVGVEGTSCGRTVVISHNIMCSFGGTVIRFSGGSCRRQNPVTRHLGLFDSKRKTENKYPQMNYRRRDNVCVDVFWFTFAVDGNSVVLLWHWGEKGAKLFILGDITPDPPHTIVTYGLICNCDSPTTLRPDVTHDNVYVNSQSTQLFVGWWMGLQRQEGGVRGWEAVEKTGHILADWPRIWPTFLFWVTVQSLINGTQQTW
jgi:hypothetical protein